MPKSPRGGLRLRTLSHALATALFVPLRSPCRWPANKDLYVIRTRSRLAIPTPHSHPNTLPLPLPTRSSPPTDPTPPRATPITPSRPTPAPASPAPSPPSRSTHARPQGPPYHPIPSHNPSLRMAPPSGASDSASVGSSSGEPHGPSAGQPERKRPRQEWRLVVDTGVRRGGAAGGPGSLVWIHERSVAKTELGAPC